jgi:hypothetical protein
MNHETVSHSKCKKCGAVKNIADLADWSAGIGMVCIDEATCKATDEASQQASTNESMEPGHHRNQSRGDA